MGLIDNLKTSALPVALDTCIFIYFIEEHPKYLSIVQPIFAEISADSLNAVTSAIALMETLVLPYRLGNILLAKQYEALFRKSRGLRCADITANTCRIAAQLRAAYSIKTPDALQLAAALMAKCSTFVTNDRVLPPIEGIHIVQIEDYLHSCSR